MTNRFVSPEQQFISNAGQPYAGGFLYFYISGTSTPTPTYQDQALTIPNSTPVVLDSAGNAGNIFLNSSILYKVVLTDSNNNTIWTFDPVIPTDAPSGTAVNAIISCTPSGGTNAITLTAINASQQPAAYANYTVFAFVPGVTTTGAVTVQVGSLAFYPVFLASGIQANANDFVAGQGPYFIAYGSVVAGATPGFLLLNPNLSASTVAISGATTVSNVHNNKILQLGGGSFYTVTFPSGSTLATNFKCTIVNEESSPIGKGIAGLQGANNGANWILYPGQSYQVFNDGGTLKIVGGIVSRYKVNTVNLFCDATNGSDDPTVADGLSSGTRAYKTLNAMRLALYQNFDHNGSQPICIASGTFNESVTFGGQPVGTGVFFWTGASPGAFVWRPTNSGSPFCCTLGDGAVLEMQNVTVDGNSINAIGIQLHQTAILDILSGCSFGAFGTGNHIGTDGAGWTLNIDASYSVTGSATNHIAASGTGTINHTGGVTVTITGSPVISNWFNAPGGPVIYNLGSSITWSGSPAAGCRKWAIGVPAAIFLGGNAANVPGSVAGVPATGSVPTATSGWASA
jgi:hypothetical protein